MRYREPRFPSDMAVRVMHNDEMHGAQLVNVSASGARLIGLGPLPGEALVTICHLHHRIRARVVWSNEKQTAVQFASPLPMADMQALRGAGGQGVGSWGASAHFGFRELS